jgi:hypothetical protein
MARTSTLPLSELPGSAGGTLNLAGTTVNTPGTLTLKGNQVNLLPQSTETSMRNTSQGGDVAWQKTTDKGTTDQKLNYNQLNVGQLAIDANHIQVGLNARDSVDALGKQPGMDWVNQLQNDPKLKDKVDWVKVEEAHKNWNYRQQGLTPEAAAVVTIVVAYFTAGAASGVGGAAGNAAAVGAGEGVALAGGGAFLTGTGAVISGVVGGAVTAGITTLASQVAVSLINNQGDIGRTLHDLGSNAGVKNLLTAIVTGGVLGGLNMNPTGLPTLEGGKQLFMDQLTQNLTAGAARAVIGTAINGGSFEKNLKDALKTSILDTIAAQAANAIGDLRDAGKLDDFTNKVAHAIAGCMVGAVRADNAGGCGAGALGAAVGEMAAEAYGKQADTVQFAAMISAMAAAITGADAAQINLASAAGGNAAANNYLNHDQWQQLADRLIECQQKSAGCSSAEQQKIRNDYQRISDTQDRALRDACADLGSSQCRTLLTEAQQGTATQLNLAQLGLLPPSYVASADFNATSRLFQQRVDAYDIIANCNTNQAQCDQQRLQGSVRLLLTGVSAAAVTVFAAELGAVFTAVALDSSGTYCAVNAQRCLNLVNGIAEMATGTPVSGYNPLTANANRAANFSRSFGEYGVTKYRDVSGNLIEVKNVIPGGLGNTGLIPGSKEAIAAAPLNLAQVQGEASFVVRVPLSTYGRNDGNLGEMVSKDLMQNATGLEFRSIQNASGNGADLSAVDIANKTIWMPDVKASTIDKFPNPTSLNLQQRSEQWIIDAANGSINNQTLSASDVAYAQNLLRLWQQGGFQIKPLVVNVSIPKSSTSGLATAVVIPIP